jgi:hypothetical protein
MGTLEFHHLGEPLDDQKKWPRGQFFWPLKGPAKCEILETARDTYILALPLPPIRPPPLPPRIPM